MLRPARIAPALTLLLATLVGCGGGGERPESLLLVTIDTLRADHLGIHGGPFPTPVLDRLAAEGVALDQGYTPTPTTGPAHASLFTGLYPWRHGVLDNAVPLQPEAPTLAGLLRERGFATAAFVASYILHPRFGFEKGFEHYGVVASEQMHWRGQQRSGFYGHGEDVTAQATAWLRTHTETDRRPFFLWVHYFDPHRPNAPPAAFVLDPPEPVDLAGKSLPEETETQAELVDQIRAYRGEVRRVDAQVGVLVEALGSLGLAGSTTVIVTADHGEGLGDHGIMGHGKALFEELVRVPLIVRGPGIPARGNIPGFAQLEDLMPTILSLLGAPVPDALDGVDLAPWLRAEADGSPRERVLGRRKTYRGQPTLFYERSGGEKWIGDVAQPGERFELGSDPREQAGKAGTPAPDALLREIGGRQDTGSAQILDAESRRALEALGYLEPDAD